VEHKSKLLRPQSASGTIDVGEERKTVKRKRRRRRRRRRKRGRRRVREGGGGGRGTL
jgi:hypothetical protein